jgi:hypothetical protein
MDIVQAQFEQHSEQLFLFKLNSACVDNLSFDIGCVEQEGM